MRHTPSMVRIAVALTLAGAGMSFAQGAPIPPIFGIHAGLAYSTISGESGGDVSSRSGFVIGGYMEQKLDDRWTLQPELQYIMKGASTSASGSGGTKVTADVKLAYVEIPVFLRINGTPSSSGITPFAQLGPQVSFKVSCDVSVTAGSVSSSSSCDSNGGEDAASVDYGVIGGVGMDMRIGGYVFSGTARYDLGLKNIGSDGDSKNRSFTFLIGLRF